MHMSARRLWMMQGFHTLSHAEPSVGAAMRALNQKGVRYGYFQTTPMARLLPEAAASGTLVAAALARAAGRLPPSRGIAAEAAARAVGYEELGPGERRCDTLKRPALVVPELGSRASARRAWRSGQLEILQGWVGLACGWVGGRGVEFGPLGAPPLPRELELAAS